MDKVPRSRNWRTSIFNVNRCYPDTFPKVADPSHVARDVAVLYALPTSGYKVACYSWTCTCEYQQACTVSTAPEIQIPRLWTASSTPPSIVALGFPTLHPLKWIWSCSWICTFHFHIQTLNSSIYFIWQRFNIMKLPGESPLIRRIILSHHLCHHSTHFYSIFYTTLLTSLFVFM